MSMTSNDYPQMKVSIGQAASAPVSLPSQTYALTDLTDVQLSPIPLPDNQILKYDLASTKWINVDLASFVQTGYIADSAITTTKIGDGQITDVKLAQITDKTKLPSDIVYSADTRLITMTKGTSTQSGTGTQKTFTIQHNLGTIPSYVDAKANSADASGSTVITKDATNISVTYTFAPLQGNSNLTWLWIAIL